ncbi:MAG: thioesterase family protein [Pseudomonadota bacterium]
MTKSENPLDAAPFVSSILQIEKDWIDYNGHLNMAYYNVLFDRCADEVFALFGVGPDYQKSRNLTIYTAEAHVRYHRELHLSDQVRVSFQILDLDEKRIHTYQEIHHVDGWLAASSEVLALHIDQSGPRVAPFPDDVSERIGRMAKAHSSLPKPEKAGQPIGIRRK